MSWATSGAIATGQRGGLIRVYRLAGGRGSYIPAAETLAHNAAVHLLLPLKDEVLVSAGKDHAIRLWDLSMGFAPAHVAPQPSAGPAPSTLWRMLAPPGTAQAARPPTRGPSGSLPRMASVALLGGHAPAAATSLLALSPDCVIAAVESSIHLWSTRVIPSPPSGQSHAVLSPGLTLRCGAPTSTLALLPQQSSALSSGAHDGTVCLWDVFAKVARGVAARPLRTIAAHTSGVSTLLVLPDGRLLTSSSGRDEALKFWDTRSGGCSGAYAVESPTLCAVLLPDGNSIASGHSDGRLLVWDVRRGRSRVAGWHTRAVTHLRVMSDGSIASGAAGGRDSVRMWATRTSDPSLCATLSSSVDGGECVVDLCAGPDKCLVVATVSPADSAVAVWAPPEPGEPAPPTLDLATAVWAAAPMPTPPPPPPPMQAPSPNVRLSSGGGGGVEVADETQKTAGAAATPQGVAYGATTTTEAAGGGGGGGGSADDDLGGSGGVVRPGSGGRGRVSDSLARSHGEFPREGDATPPHAGLVDHDPQAPAEGSYAATLALHAQAIAAAGGLSIFDGLVLASHATEPLPEPANNAASSTSSTPTSSSEGSSSPSTSTSPTSSSSSSRTPSPVPFEALRPMLPDFSRCCLTLWIFSTLSERLLRSPPWRPHPLGHWQWWARSLTGTTVPR